MRVSRRVAVVVLVGAALLGAIVAPRVAEAVGSIVTIQGGGSTTKAAVTKANQLQTAEAAPSAFREFTTSSGPTGCLAFGTVPSTKGFIAKSVVLDVPVKAVGGLELVTVYPNGTCTGREMVSAPTSVIGDYSFPFEPGFAVGHGKHFSMKVVSAGAVAAVYVTGYLVPSGDVPATTPISS
jgi:hypothetical protein